MATGITETDVWKAADALLLEGLRPTIERVRQKIGRGSPNTVSPYLETWFKTLGARIKDPGVFSAPAALPDPIQQAAKYFWETALTAARAELEEQATAQRAELEDSRRVIAEQKQGLESREAAMQGQLRAQAQSLELAQRETNELHTRLDERNEALRKHATEIGNASKELTAARAQLTELQGRLDSERTQWAAERRNLEARYQANEQRWALEVDRAREQSKRVEAELVRDRSQFAGERTRWDEQREVLEAEAQARHRRESALHTDLDTAQAELERLKQDHARVLEAACVREDELLQRAARAESQLADALEEMKQKGSELAHLVRQLVEQSRNRKTEVSARRRKS